MELVTGISVPLDTPLDKVKALAARKLGWPVAAVQSMELMRRAIDARKKDDVRLVYSVALSRRAGETLPLYAPAPCAPLRHRPIVVGFGPAGMMCALVLAQAGLRPIVLERGLDVDTRTRKVREFWQNGQLDPQCNVQFGEGGAGAFSDGKLATGTGNKEWQRYVLATFVRHGAPPEIMYDAKPHVGTDRLVAVVKGIRQEILARGGDVYCGVTVQNVCEQNGLVTVQTTMGDMQSQHVVLAIGHSARDTYAALHAAGLALENKPFAVGVRIEHLQADISRALYGKQADHPALGPADYKLVCHTPYGGVYSFCMCPGGHVVASSAEENTVVTNGMSYSRRDGTNANAALLVGVDQQDYGTELFAGVRYQQQLERLAYTQGGGGYYAPCQRWQDFDRGTLSQSWGKVRPTYRPGVTPARLDEGLAPRIVNAMRWAMPHFAKQIVGYDNPDALLTGYETRSSSPVRIVRDPDMLSAVGHTGIYPCGEGCGYAGGIMSAATDGIRVAERIMEEVR